MITIEVRYKDMLRCSLTHTPSGSTIESDAPIDNFGRGSTFSPTDLCAASLASCMLTTMGIVAQKNNFHLKKCEATVNKIMTNVPMRRIAKLPVTIRLGKEYTPEQIEILHQAAETCPVKQSLHDSIEVTIDWQGLQDAVE